MNLHPAQKFKAPTSIQAGVSLKDLMDGKLIRLIAESMVAVHPGFRTTSFVAAATKGLDKLELKDRARHIAHAMAEQLPSTTSDAMHLLVKSLGPELQSTEGNGLAVFFYLPHTSLIAEYGVNCFSSGMLANYEITKRFTAEFSIRSFVIQHETLCLNQLRTWVSDANPHVRRLVSEGTRPRLPWAMRLPSIQENPQLTIPLLELLKDDDELYVRRSVANHLGDLAKDHPETIFDLCHKWLDEVTDNQEAFANNRRWVIRHALRHPDKQGVRRATELRIAAGGKRK
ncbi:MAG: hypothetical protein KDA91_13665 [Planctomycetaceae bacterium]|nr:hypothetical protein [Planctomycetaceae bacterium]